MVRELIEHIFSPKKEFNIKNTYCATSSGTLGSSHTAHSLNCIIVSLHPIEKRKGDETKYGMPFPVKCAIIKYGRKCYVII